jgi:single-stranded-DNA-specific exonuclease
MSLTIKKKAARPSTIWEFRTNDTQDRSNVPDGITSPLLVRVLSVRKLGDSSEISSFLNPRLASIQDPYLIKDMEKAVKRIRYALDHNEKICIFGDYDVDGITATVLLMRYFKWLGREVDYYIPNRISEGYGMNRSAIERISKKGINLIITVDNGISALEEIAYANSLGMDVIVTDHHQSGDVLPEAVAIVNPNRKDADRVHTPLAGVGVAFKLIYAVSKTIDIDSSLAKSFLVSLLDLVALGTVADIVALTGENRILVKHGLQRLKDSDKIGLKTLLQITCSQSKEITPNTISFYLAPRINAAGRTDQASICVDLLLTEDNLKAVELTRTLNNLNDERRKLEADIHESCLNLLEQREDIKSQKILVIDGEGWHLGVVGIVASRILEQYYKPVIILAVDRDKARGSGRSIEGFDLHKALDHCKEFFTAYGGHKRAVGLSIPAKSIPDFRKKINEYAAEHLDIKNLHPRLKIDAELTADDLTFDNVTALSVLEPYGTSNPPPVFTMKNVSLLEEPRIVGRDHLKLTIIQDGISIPGIGFSMGDFFTKLNEQGQNFHIAFTPFINEWKGYKTVEMEIKDIKFD